MIRILVLLKRKPGLTMQEFITHFETKHAAIGKKIFTGNAVKYSRKYLTPIEDPRGDTPIVPTYDAVMDIAKNHFGAYGIGVEYAYTMVHGAPPSKFPEYVIPVPALAAH